MVPYQDCTNDDHRLTYFFTKSKLLPYAFIWGKSSNCKLFKIIILARKLNIMRQLFYISTKGQAEFSSFIKGHSFWTATNICTLYLIFFSQKTLC